MRCCVVTHKEESLNLQHYYHRHLHLCSQGTYKDPGYVQIRTENALNWVLARRTLVVLISNLG